MPAVYGLKKKITRKSRSYRRSGGGGGWKILGSITWFSGEVEGDQLSSIEYKGGGIES